ncbi:hypothetical protein BDZ97DRAFT_52857 [Flammula alnicola]|nr:hypothetical protein BDZ97DRAFT_52857 [Flammula alnicola]
MASWVDLFTLVTVIATIYGTSFIVASLCSWMRCVMNTTKEHLTCKGIHITSHSVSLEVSTYASYPEYVEAHKRAGRRFVREFVLDSANRRYMMESDGASCSLQ